ncbi:precorrin-3B C(17)-methyltransferase [Halanaerobium hydrogeniformans]|uniref:Precorrin-3B C17-methyltransferase n=1 Tax=Halanaerobium hydrogeniformans TaxID=656519 RepID=E4RK96_HALHG|nr:precorrin-3B C(17)-methyltransferase [Halanaerobium hydrogeniformans]ADQ15609.1 precorrin-3B C17-methyltransferase [Halanaerobium hydrogeniformans]
MQLNKDLYIIGIGPGNLADISRKAYQVLNEVDVIVGYKKYIECIKELTREKQQLYSTGMRKEMERVEKAVGLAAAGKKVALISSGDAGVYGMAGPAFELIAKNDIAIEVEVIAGITAANAAAAVLGAPLMHDYVVISLSDILTPWDQIKKRLKAAAEADFITTLYNPRSSRRKMQLQETQKIFLKHRSPDTPVGIVKSVGRDGEELMITTLSELPLEKVDMLTTVIIGNSNTYVAANKIITPRGYKI